MQPVAVATENVAVPPAAATVVLVGLTVNVHAAAWVIEKVFPAIVSVPLREVDAAFGATE